MDSLLAYPKSVSERFWAKVNRSADCWLWTAATNDCGYGQLRVGERIVYAHRLAYEMLIGPIPPGLTIDHLCRVRKCVNPTHLEPVTTQENTRRSGSGSMFVQKRAQAQRARTHCLRGHPFDSVNTRWYRGWRHCRTCKREWKRPAPK